jgi:hypothetical protein
LPLISVSNVADMPAAPLPRLEKMLSVSKVSKFWLPEVAVICSDSRPPFGASGLT